MAINVEKLVYRIRYKAKDMDAVLYSDYDVLEAINECIRYLNQEKALKNSDFLEKRTYFNEAEMNAEIKKYNKEHPEEEPKELLNFAETGVDLPEDLITLVDITRGRDGYHLSPVPAVEGINPHYQNQYKIINGKLYTNTDFYLLYRAEIAQLKLADLTDKEAIVELPEVFTDLLIKVSVMILTNTADNDVMAREISRVAENLIPGRRYNNIKIRMPFHV